MKEFFFKTDVTVEGCFRPSQVPKCNVVITSFEIFILELNFILSIPFS